MTGSLELLCVGRVSVDLYAEQLGVPLHDVRTFRKSIGGTATNVAVAAARLGRRAAIATRVGDDPFGGYVRRALVETFGVDTTFVGIDAEFRTPLAFAVMDPPEEPSIDFYREPRAPDQELSSDDVSETVAAEVPILWISASRFSSEPSRTTVRALLDGRRRRPHTILDLDWRPAFWPDRPTASREVGTALESFTMAVGNRTECEIAVGTPDPDEAADRLLDQGLHAAIVKMGGDGVLVAAADGTRERIPPVPVDVLSGLGAGDAFGGALCHGLLAGWDLPQAVRFGNAAGAIVASRLMCADDMPTVEEVDALMETANAG